MTQKYDIKRGVLLCRVVSSVNVYVIFSPEKCTGYSGKLYICNVNKIYSGNTKKKLAMTETV